MKSLENIRNGLLNKASGKFNTNNQQLDREKELLINWMSFELYGLYKELGQSRDYVEKNVLRRLSNEYSNRPTPVHAIAQAIPKKAEKVLKAGEDLFTIDSLSNRVPNEIYFSPLKPTKLTGAKVKFRYSGNSISEVKRGNETKKMAQTKTFLHPSVLWIGIEAHSEFDYSKNDLTFHFDWGKEDRYNNCFDLLPSINWSINDSQLNSKEGLDNIFHQEKSTKARFLDEEYLRMNSLEKTIINQCKNQFITIETEKTFEAGLPSAIKENIEVEVLENIQAKKLIWIKMVYPNSFSSELIQKTKIRLNCFPIINRKLDKTRDFSPQNFGSLEIIALSNSDNRRNALNNTGDIFLGIKNIRSHKVDYRPVAFESFKEAPLGYYALQHGRVEASDFRDVLVRSKELTSLIKEHSSRLQHISGHEMQAALNSLERGCLDFENALVTITPQAKDPGYYLYLKAQDPTDMIYVQFWLTQGGVASGLMSSGANLIAGKSGEFEEEGALVI